MLFVVVLLGLLSVASAGNAWFTQFKPGTEYWVSPNATLGVGACSKTEPCSFSHAAREEQKGDGVIYWLLPGNYTSETGTFVIECNGQLNRPCVFRCVEDHKCWFKGSVEIRASEAWLWGVKISELDDIFENPCPVSVGSTPPNYYVRVHVINNLIYGVTNPGGPKRYGMCFSNDIGTVVYGNIVYGEAPNLNISNSYAVGNYKYVVGNMFLSPSNETNVNAVVDANTDGMGEITGLYFAKNVFSDGKVIAGSKNRPDLQNVFLPNQFVNSELQVGVDQPGQFQVVDNRLVRSNVKWPRMWGTGEEQYPEKQQLISSFTKNVLMGDVEGDAVQFGTGSYKLDKNEKDEVYFVKTVNIRNDTLWNANQYYAFSSTYNAHGVFEAQMASSKWKSLTRLGGREFDKDSLFNITLPRSQQILVPNEYDGKRVHISFYVHYPEILPTTITFDLCCVFSASEEERVEWSLYEYHELGRTEPSFSSTKNDSCTVQIPFGEEMARFFILITNKDISLEGCPDDIWVQDTELKLEIITNDDSEEVSSSTLIAAIVGAICFTLFIAISVFYYRQKHKDDLEWKAMKEREAQEAEVSE